METRNEDEDRNRDGGKISNEDEGHIPAPWIPVAIHTILFLNKKLPNMFKYFS